MLGALIETLRRFFGNTVYLALIALAGIVVFYAFDRNNVYFKVDSRIVDILNNGSRKCNNFDAAYYNVLISNDLKNVSIDQNQIITDETNISFLSETANRSLFQQSISLLADQSYLTQLISKTGLLSNSVKPVVLYFQLDEACQMQQVTIVHEKGTKVVPMNSASTFPELARAVLREVNEYFYLKEKVNSDPVYVRGRALAHVAEEDEVARYANLAGIAYLIESNRVLPADAPMLHGKAAYWFERALASDPGFQAAAINLEKTRIKLAWLTSDASLESAGIMLGRYYREGKKGYLDAASAMLMDVVEMKARADGVSAAAHELHQAKNLAATEVARFGGTTALFRRLEKIHAYLAAIDDRGDNASLSADYADAALALEADVARPAPVSPRQAAAAF